MGQDQRLALPTTPPLSHIHRILRAAISELHAFGCSGAFAAFDFKVKNMRFTTSLLHSQNDDVPHEIINAAQREAVTMQELLFVTGETNGLKQADRFTAPTHLSEDNNHPLLHFCMRADDEHWRANLAYPVLLMGDYRIGARLYQHRNIIRPTRIAEYDYPIRGEQGIGDELFFLRYIDKKHPFALRLNHKLIPLLARNGYNVDPNPVVATKSIPIGDFFDGVQPSIRLTPSNLIKHIIEKELAGYPKPWTAITLTAGIDTVNQNGALWQQYKSFPLKHANNIIPQIKGTVFMIDRNYTPYSTLSTHDYSEINDNLETAIAFLDCMDHYVGVSNTNMHLYAALGKRADVLIPWVPEWRWGLRESSPFFPEFGLYRQSPNGSWNTAIDKLTHSLHFRGLLK